MTPPGPDSVAVFAMLSPTTHPGPHAMTKRLADGFIAAGIDPVELVIVESETVRGLIRTLIAAASSSKRIVILRHVEVAAPLICLVGIVLRARRRVFVLQVATPVSSAPLDTNRRRSRLFHLASRAVIAVFHPIVFIVPHLILQYAPERGRMSRIGTGKTILVSHPIYAMKSRPVLADPPILRAVGIAGSANSPGFDRFLRGVFELGSDERHEELEIVIVGHSEVLQAERSLAQRLGLKDRVTFTGALFGADLDDVLATAAFGIGSLAGHRIGLDVGSPLKHRTYLSFGLPIVTSVNDPGLPPGAPWVHQVPADDTPIDIRAVLDWVTALPQAETRRAIESWARANLSAESVAAQILEAIRIVAGPSGADRATDQPR